jgi:hypothetical protein
MAGAADAAQALLGVPTVASTQAAGQSALTQYFNFDLQWFGLFILAGGFPLPPFSYLGFAGLNLYAVGSMTYFGVKAGLQTILTLANTYLLAYYPKLWWVGYLLVLNPWYVFDLVQMFSPAFPKEGFKVPFFHTPLGAAGKMTPALAALAVGAMSVGSYSLINMLPVELQASYKPLLNSIFLTVGTLAAVTGGGLSSMLVLPQAYSAIKSSLGEAGAAAAAAPIPAPTGAQKGGGAPSLSDVARKIEVGKITLQDGGGGSDPSAAVFLGTLGVAALGGISLALIRSKAVSSS